MTGALAIVGAIGIVALGVAIGCLLAPLWERIAKKLS